MSLELPFGLKVLNPLPVDDKYLNNGTPYANSAAVLAAIPQAIRHVGLTVNIANVEYWFKDGVTDPDLILKSAGFALVNGSGTTVNGTNDGVDLGGEITVDALLQINNTTLTNKKFAIDNYKPVGGPYYTDVNFEITKAHVKVANEDVYQDDVTSTTHQRNADFYFTSSAFQVDLVQNVPSQIGVIREGHFYVTGSEVKQYLILGDGSGRETYLKMNQLGFEFATFSDGTPDDIQLTIDSHSVNVNNFLGLGNKSSSGNPSGPPGGVIGTLILDTDTSTPKFWDGSVWVSFLSTGISGISEVAPGQLIAGGYTPNDVSYYTDGTPYFAIGDVSFPFSSFSVVATNILLQGPVSFLNAADPTKIALFDTSAITAATTRTYTLPDNDGTIALLSDITPSITNSGAVNEVVKSDGTNIIGTTVFSTAAGNLTLGSASEASVLRVISAINSTNDAALTILAQGAILIDGQNGQIAVNPYSIEFGGGTYVNSSLTGGTPTYGAGEGVIFIKSASVNPGSNPTGGGILYGDLSDSHKLKWRTPDGTVYDLTTTGGGSGYATIQEEGTPLTQRFVLNFTSNGITAVDDAGNSRTNVSLNAVLTALANYNSDGILTQTAANTFVGRTLTGTNNRIVITDGDGVAGVPTFDVGANIIDKSVANSYTAGAKQTFSHSATTAGINIGPVAGAPSVPANGDLWVDDTLKDFYLYVDGNPYALTRNPVKDVSGTTYTFLESDRGKILRFTDASGCTANAPNGLSLNWSVIVYRAVGAGVLTITATSTFVEGAGTTLDTEATMAALHQRGSNTFILSGAVGASSGPAFGTAAQIPYMNGGGTNFSYEAGFEYDAANNKLVVPNISASSGTTTLTLSSNNGTGSQIVLPNSGILQIGSSTTYFTYTAGSDRFDFAGATNAGLPTIFVGRTGIVSSVNGDGIKFVGGAGYATSGDGNGGNITIQSGQRRTAGTGVDGLIILDPLTRWIEVSNTTGTVSVNVNTAAMYVKDIAAGNAAFHFKTENGQEIKLYQVNAGSAYTITNGTTDRTFDANSYTTDELADVLYSLITDLKLTGIIA